MIAEHLERITSDMLTHDVVDDILIGRAESDVSDSGTSELACAIDGLMTGLGYEAESWQESFVGGHQESAFSENLRPIDVAKHMTEGLSLGEYVVGLAFRRLPIGSNEDTESVVDVSLMVGGASVVRIHTEACYEGGTETEDYWFIECTARIMKVVP
jgi:hypothetical protein